MIEDIRTIVSDAVMAPSGENCQPWRFSLKDNVLTVFNVPDADRSVYNFKQKGSYFAHGALIENAFVSAAHHGYHIDLKYFDPENEQNCVSELTFIKKEENHNSDDFNYSTLYAFIRQRCTNRKEHTAVKLSHQQKEELNRAATYKGISCLKITDSISDLRQLGEAIAINDQVIFENKGLHDFFYEHIIWKDDEQKKSGGFYYKTLEFLPHQLKAVKLFKNWSILSVLNKFTSVSKKIGIENSKKYINSGAIAIIVSNGNSAIDYLNAGRLAQRVWLTATKLGLAVHPCTGTIYFMENIKGGNKNIFSKEQIKTITEGYDKIDKVFNINDQTIPMLFRLGFAKEPSAVSLRMAPDLKVI